MRLSRACLVALLLALGFALGCATARAAGLDEALAHFTTDDFSDTTDGINAVAASGNPRAETIIRALQDGQLMFSAERKAVYIKDDSGKLTDAATGQPIAGDAPADLDNVRINNRLRGAIDAALGGLTLLGQRSRRAIRGRAGGVQVARGKRAADARHRHRQGAGPAGQARAAGGARGDHSLQ